jgi:UDP-2,3-diacylglucosamine pyrophosphatase LpxH
MNELPNDRIVGRPIRLNRQVLKPQRGKNYAEVVFLGDCHLGSPQFDQSRFLAMTEYCLKNNIYVFLMGDMIELATRHSVGGGVYEQAFPGQTQHEVMCEWLTPLANKKLILGLLQGNHEERVYKESGVNISKAMARELSIPYLGDACWNMFRVGDRTYTIYSLHGRTGSKFDGTALLALERLAAPFHADLVVMGHAHKCISSSVLMQTVRKGSVVEHKKHLLITGSYLKYGGYAQTFGLPPSKLGSPKVKFMADRHDISISW